jgi:hypothetical protein
MALIWAAGIVWFALQVAGPTAPAGNSTEAQATDVTGAPIKDKDVKQLEKVIEGL